MNLDSQHLADALIVSPTTIQKWHKQGLPCQAVTVTGADGRPRRHILHLASTTARWLCDKLDHSNPPEWAQIFAELADPDHPIKTSDPAFHAYLAGFLYGLEIAGEQLWADLERQKANSSASWNLAIERLEGLPSD
jgi:hypothetical protein